MDKNGRHELLNEVEETAGVVYKDILDLIQQKLPWTIFMCFRPRLHESRLIFKTAYPFTWIRADEALNHSGDRFQKDSRLI